jgi:ParB family chromosome partitioning protein
MGCIADTSYLIAGLHRLEAAKQLGGQTSEANLVALEGVKAEWAEIAENLIRS